MSPLHQSERHAPHLPVCPIALEDDLIDSLADPSKMGDLEDPKELAGWMKRVGREMGEDLGDLEEAISEEMDQPE